MATPNTSPQNIIRDIRIMVEERNMLLDPRIHKYLKVINQQVCTGKVTSGFVPRRISFNSAIDVGTRLVDLSSTHKDGRLHSTLMWPDETIVLQPHTQLTANFSSWAVQDRGVYIWLHVLGAYKPYIAHREVPVPIKGMIVNKLYISRFVVGVVKECLHEAGGSWTLADGAEIRLPDLVLLNLVEVGDRNWQAVLAYEKTSRDGDDVS